ncbi:phycobiliprotein lyase [Synechococcus sp. BA-124 BA4]|jgi:phycoerythrin-associated linker protein|uniref:phycobiliprotein lyase n=1 Tax=unclassified Synechococcus TaxID=2626047 RepID=UPI002B20FE30|nr:MULTISPECIES: phycobiliprotein lyase [unclassified Synechococcus]MEA5398909.1 phycobiliprotein lyase [Synechococcus sp. BA-124 BA4]MEA5413783.1 phycobiliprotein lyase [Synechococcus sp. BA-132 BA5]
MIIDHFVERSQGSWRSMRSAHSLAFRQFEEVLSDIKIKLLSAEDTAVLKYLSDLSIPSTSITSPFQMTWEADSDWEPEDPSAVSSGSCMLIPVPLTEREGKLLRSVGYAEAEPATSTYQFLDDDTFILHTSYGQSIAEERIWFVSDHVRCRSSVLRTSAGSGVLQTSFASEVRRMPAE